MSKEIEEWRPIKDYEGLYEVSDWGNVRSIDRIVPFNTGWGKKTVKKLKGRQLSKLKGTGGYFHINLCKNGIRKQNLIHIIVAETFIPNPENKEQVGHLKKLADGTEDKTANEVWNLAWMTPKENANYGTRVERCAEKHKGFKHSEETKKRISDSLKGEKNHMFGKHHTDEIKKKMSEAKKGKKLTDEAKKKISEVNKNRTDNKKQVYQYNLDGLLVAIWSSANECGRNGYSRSGVSMCCNGKLKKYKGYRWSFEPL